MPLDEKDEMIIGLLQQVKDLEGQFEERKEWIQQIVAQAATKVADKLRREREKRLEKGKHTLENLHQTHICMFGVFILVTHASILRKQLCYLPIEAPYGIYILYRSSCDAPEPPPC